MLELEDFQAAVSIWLVRSGPAGPFEPAIAVLRDTVADLLSREPCGEAATTDASSS
jgi:hypothetical protein